MVFRLAPNKKPEWEAIDIPRLVGGYELSEYEHEGGSVSIGVSKGDWAAGTYWRPKDFDDFKKYLRGVKIIFQDGEINLEHWIEYVEQVEKDPELYFYTSC